MCIGHTIRHFVKTQHQEYPLWHFANRYVFRCIKRRMAIRHFVKTENSFSDSPGILIAYYYETMTFQHLKLSRNVSDNEYPSNIYTTEFEKNTDFVRIRHFVISGTATVAIFFCTTRWLWGHCKASRLVCLGPFSKVYIVTALFLFKDKYQSEMVRTKSRPCSIHCGHGWGRYTLQAARKFISLVYWLDRGSCIYIEATACHITTLVKLA